MAIKASATITLIRVDDLEGLEIGGRNLLLGSSDLDLTSWKFDSSESKLDTTYQKFGNNSVKIICDNSDGSARKYRGFDAINVQSVSFDEVKGKNLIFSMWLYIEDVGDVSGYEFRVVYDHEGVTQWNKVNKDYPYNIPSAADLKAGWNYLYGVFTIAEDATMYYTSFNIHADVGESTGPCWVSSPKLEFGLTPTDWTPAPEDVQQGIDNAQSSADSAQDTADSANEAVQVAQASIEILNNSIKSLVTDENGSSLMTQTSDGWTFNIGGIQNSVEETANSLNEVIGDVSAVNQLAQQTSDLANDLAEKTAYITISQDETGDPCMVLGRQDSPFQLRITNTSIDFMEGTSRIAYITNHQLYIQSSVVTDEMKVGADDGFVWRKRGNGNMGLRWEAGTFAS